MEVILTAQRRQFNVASILHVCGGDPDDDLGPASGLLYSPRVWRWSPDVAAKDMGFDVFSTCVEVILWGRLLRANENRILHVCGGDPTWSISNWVSQVVFSTCVEVILISSSDLAATFCILHVCGGDP